MSTEVFTRNKITVIEFDCIINTDAIEFARPELIEFESLSESIFLELDHQYSSKKFREELLWRLKNSIISEVNGSFRHSERILPKRYLEYCLDRNLNFELSYDEYRGSIKFKNGKLIVDAKLLAIIGLLWASSITFLEDYPDVRVGLKAFSGDVSKYILSALDETAENNFCRLESIAIERIDPSKMQGLIDACLREERLQGYHALKNQIRTEMQGTDY